jgi:predicted DNA-binding protein
MQVAKTETQISMRVTYEFKARLEAQAEKEHRPVANLIHKVMEEYLDQQEKQA